MNDHELTLVGLGSPARRHHFLGIFGRNILSRRFQKDCSELHRLDPNPRVFVEPLGNPLEALQRSRRDGDEPFITPRRIRGPPASRRNLKARLYFRGELYGPLGRDRV